jgi:hypothetical protein
LFQITPLNHNQSFVGLTVCVTGAGAGVDKIWEQKKIEARKLFENAAESPASSARCVGTLFIGGLYYDVGNSDISGVGRLAARHQIKS